jgi:hypothetical protein
MALWLLLLQWWAENVARLTSLARRAASACCCGSSLRKQAAERSILLVFMQLWGSRRPAIHCHMPALDLHISMARLCTLPDAPDSSIALTRTPTVC